MGELLQLKLEDFIPGYAHFGDDYREDEFDIYEDEPENVFYKKKEFYKNRLEATEKKPSGPGIPLKTQHNISRFLSTRTLNDEMLLLHGVGSGKTCSAVNISELSKAINPYLKPTLVLVSGENLRRNFMAELAMKCTKGQYIPANYESLTDREKVTRMKKLISKSYEIHTFEKFCKYVINKARDSYLKKEYSNRVIIIDEAHHIHIQPKKKEEKLNIYESIHRFLHLLENRKIVLLTATPMRDLPNEFGGLMNLILPLNKQLPTGIAFNKKFFDSDGKIKNGKELRKTIRGRISYIRSMESSVIKNFMGEVLPPMKRIKIYPSKMSDFQTRGYTKAYNNDKKTDIDIKEIEKEEKKEVKSLYTKSRQASLFIFPDESYGPEGFDKYIEKEKTGVYSLTKEFKNLLPNNGKATHNQIIENIEKYSSIYAATIKEIYRNENENAFVYNEYVHGSGAILFSKLLELVGYERTRGYIDVGEEDEEVFLEDIIDIGEEIEEKIEDVSEKEAEKEEKESRKKPKKRRFAIITGETVSPVEVDRILGKFNASNNKTGDYIQVIIGSQIIGEGKSLNNIRQIHIQTPHWNNSETEQAIGRGIRAFSLDDFKESADKYHKVYRHAAFSKSGVESIDYYMYKISEDKDVKIKQIERICKEEAVDCMLNMKRNKLDTDEDESRECDYMQCDYKCSTSTDMDIPPDKLITDTYNLYYAEDELESITARIKELYRKKFSYDLAELIEKFGEVSSIVIVRALKRIIDKSIQLINRYGFPCFLREDRNLYFLVDTVVLPSSFTLSRYSQHPNIKPYYTFEDMINIAQYKYLGDKIDIIEDTMEVYDEDNDEDKKTIIKQLDSLSPQLKEIFLEKAIIGDKLKEKKKDEHKILRNIIIDHFRNYIEKLPDKTVSKLLYDEEEKLRCLRDDAKKYEDWYDCEDTVLDEIKDAELTETVNLEINEYGYYGSIGKDKKFRIIDMKDLGKSHEDHRKNARGAVCENMVPKQKILNIIDHINSKELNVEPPITIEMKDREKFINDIKEKTNKYKRKELEKMDDDRLKSIYYFYVKATKPQLCQTLNAWFKKNNLILYEKK